jgi:cytidylate kinase
MNPVNSIIWEWRSSISPETYMRHVRDSIKAVAREGNGIIIGRGANYILRGPDYLHVRLVAPLELRVAMYVAGEGVTDHEAKRWIKEQDEKRGEFIQKYYHHSIDDPVWYDLIINLDGLSLEAIADIIVQASKRRQEEHLTPETTLPKYKELLAHRHRCRPNIVEHSNQHPHN